MVGECLSLPMFVAIHKHVPIHKLYAVAAGEWEQDKENLCLCTLYVSTFLSPLEGERGTRKPEGVGRETNR